jgi:hypothetical protein
VEPYGLRFLFDNERKKNNRSPITRPSFQANGYQRTSLDGTGLVANNRYNNLKSISIKAEMTSSKTAMKPTETSNKKTKSTKSKSFLRIRKPKSSMLNVSLSEIAAKARKLAPKEDWDKLPTDLAKNLDHYLYGSKKID